MKDHEIRELVNDIRALAIEYHAHQSRRDRVAHLVVPHLTQAALQIPELTAAIRRIRELEAQVVALTLELNRYKEREKTMGWNQS